MYNSKVRIVLRFLILLCAILLIIPTIDFIRFGIYSDAEYLSLGAAFVPTIQSLVFVFQAESGNEVGALSTYSDTISFSVPPVVQLFILLLMIGFDILVLLMELKGKKVRIASFFLVLFAILACDDGFFLSPSFWQICSLIPLLCLFIIRIQNKREKKS